MSKLTTLFSSVLGVPESDVIATLSPETCSAWDSLNAIILITEIEKEFETRFEYEEAMGVKNFADVITLVASKGCDPYA